MEAKDKAFLIAKALSDKKGLDIIILELEGLTLVADYFVLATGKSATQVQSLAENVLDEMAKHELKELRIEGQREARWILVDFGDVVVHVFQEEDRHFYDLERLWGDAKKLEYVEDEVEI